METEEIIKSVSIERLIDALNACADPFERYSYIMENDEDTLDDIGATEGTLWVLQAVSERNRGRFNEKDAYLICDAPAHTIYTFSTKDELINYIGLINLAEILDENREIRRVAELFAEYETL